MDDYTVHSFYKNVLLILVIFNSNVAFSNDVKTISVMNISVGNEMEKVKNELEKVFLNEEKLKSKNPGKTFSNTSPLKCSATSCRGSFMMYQNHKLIQTKNVEVSFNKFKKAYRIRYTQMAKVADNFKECEKILLKEDVKAVKQYGKNFGLSSSNGWGNSSRNNRYGSKRENTTESDGYVDVNLYCDQVYNKGSIHKKVIIGSKSELLKSTSSYIILD